jgi:hypothetical protein
MLQLYTPYHMLPILRIFEKHNPEYSGAFLMWSFLQMVFTLALMCFLFYRIDQIPHSDTLLYGAFLLVSIFAYTSVMDKKFYGIFAMAIQTTFGIAIIVTKADWFGLSDIWSFAPIILAGYFMISAISALIFQLTEFSSPEENSNAEMQ